MTPPQELAQALKAEPAVLLAGANVYAAPQELIDAPAIVLRPDEPWIVPGPTFHALTENYLAILVAPAASPVDGLATIHTLAHAVMDNLPDGWTFHSVGRLLVDESTGQPFLACAVRLSYADCPGGDPE